MVISRPDTLSREQQLKLAMLLTRDDCKGRRSSTSAVVEMGVDIISFDMKPEA
jgi:hypothetical protein